MIENINGISIKGRCYKDLTKLKIFNKNTDRLAIVYGKNGSGKSTISEGVESVGIAEKPIDLETVLIDSTGNCLPDEDFSNKIYVFNEHYIDKNVKIDGDGLGTIVLLGGQATLQEDIDKAEKAYNSELLNFESSKQELDKYKNIANTLSPFYHMEEIKKLLRSGWADRGRQLTETKRNLSVNDAIVNEICKLTVKAKLDDLSKEYISQKELLKRTDHIVNPFPEAIKTISFDESLEEKICELLCKVIERPRLTERETLIMESINSGFQNRVEEARKIFNDRNIEFCPYCFRAIDEEYRNSILASINRVLNKDVDIHIAELDAVTFPEFSSYERYENLDGTIIKQIVKQIKICESLINEYKKLITQKKANIFVSLNCSNKELSKEILTLNELLISLEFKRQEFEKSINHRKDIISNLLDLNKKIARFEIDLHLQTFNKQNKELEVKQKIVNKNQESLAKAKKELDELNQQKANIKLAINSINKALRYIFFDKDRLSIELKDGKYFLKSNGQHVRPKNISVGERNIIALCYFFTHIMSNQDVAKLYKKEMFIVLDDPVSSFDYDNRIGIMSFLRKQIGLILSGNINSKLLILTHDLTTMFALIKIRKDLIDEFKSESIIVSNNCNYVLYAKNLKEFNNSKNEYHELLNNVYKFACGDDEDNNLTIGNVMRRVLEVFSTFNYRKSIEAITTDKNVLNLLKEYSDYFKNLMYRLVLHGESHYEEQVYALKDNMNFYEFITIEEKIRTAKDVLCLMFILNESHIMAQLGDCPGAIENIKSWLLNIPQNEEEHSKVLSFKTKIIPLYDLKISAGCGNQIFDETTPFEEFAVSNQNADFALKIDGDSMEPTIFDGNIVLVKKSEIIEEGKIGAFFF